MTDNRRRDVFKQNFSQALDEILIPFDDLDLAYDINPVFRFFSVFFEKSGFRGVSIGELPQVVKSILYPNFGAYAKGYDERILSDPERDDIEFYARQFLTMDSYRPILNDLIKKHFPSQILPSREKLHPCLKTEREILFELLLDSFGLRDKEKRSLEKLADEREWRQETVNYWIDLMLDGLSKNMNFCERLFYLLDDIMAAKLLTTEQEIAWKKERLSFDLEKKQDRLSFEVEEVLDHLYERPSSHGNEIFQGKKRRLLTRLHRYGISGLQLAKEFGFQKQTVYRHDNNSDKGPGLDKSGIELAIEDYLNIDSPDLRSIIERHVFNPELESIAKSTSDTAGNHPLFRLLSDTGRVRLPDFSFFAQVIFYDRIGDRMGDIEEEIKQSLFNDEGLSEKTIGFLREYLPEDMLLVLNCQYGFTTKKKGLANLGNMLGVSTSSAFYYKRQAMGVVRKNKELRRGLLRLWRKAINQPKKMF